METQSTRAECAPKPSPELRGRALVEACQRSGLSQVAYARQHHIGPHLLSYWKRRLRLAKSTTAIRVPSVPAATDFVQVAIPMPSPSPSLTNQSGSPLEILLSCGAIVRVVPGVNAALLHLVMRTLVGDRC